MHRHYTRVCNFYYGNSSKKLVNKKKTIPLNGIEEISFDQIEIITRNSKKKIFVNQIKYLPKLMRIKINLDLNLNDKIPGIEIISTVKTTGPTGVEMEALTAASISALTVYDMVKSLDKSIIIKDLRLIFKDGGKSGLYESS